MSAKQILVNLCAVSRTCRWRWVFSIGSAIAFTVAVRDWPDVIKKIPTDIRPLAWMVNEEVQTIRNSFQKMIHARGLLGRWWFVGWIVDALQSLSRRCIIVNRERTWSILPVTIAYVIGRSIDLSWNLPHVTSSMRPLRICNSIFPTSTPAEILSQWQTLEPILCGYLAGNILNLRIELEPNIKIWDL